MNNLLENKRILVTGAARGLGFAFAEAIGQAGAQVVIADILTERGQASAQQLGAAFVPLDLAEPESIQNCADNAAEILGGLDGVVNNGAIATGIGGKTFEEFDIDTWDRVMAVNARSTWLMTRAVVPYLRKSGAGAIVNIASVSADNGDYIVTVGNIQGSGSLSLGFETSLAGIENEIDAQLYSEFQSFLNYIETLEDSGN